MFNNNVFSVKHLIGLLSIIVIVSRATVNAVPHKYGGKGGGYGDSGYGSGVAFGSVGFAVPVPEPQPVIKPVYVPQPVVKPVYVPQPQPVYVPQPTVPVAPVAPVLPLSPGGQNQGIYPQQGFKKFKAKIKVKA